MLIVSHYILAHTATLGHFPAHQYPYMRQLAALEAQRPQLSPTLQTVLAGIGTPLHLEAWREGLDNHPDRSFAQFIIYRRNMGKVLMRE